MAKTNYQFEKRQRDLAKKRKQEEKQRQKLANKAPAASGGNVAVNPSEDAPPENGHKSAGPPDSASKPEE